MDMPRALKQAKIKQLRSYRYILDRWDANRFARIEFRDWDFFLMKFGDVRFRPFDSEGAQALWEEIGPEFVARFIKEKPCRRPAIWWWFSPQATGFGVAPGTQRPPWGKTLGYLVEHSLLTPEEESWLATEEQAFFAKDELAQKRLALAKFGTEGWPLPRRIVQ
jgi:hypothetical protein